MEFHSVSEFLAMGRHGLYVWLSYGLTALIVAFSVIAPLRRRKQLQTELVRRRRREEANAEAHSSSSGRSSTASEHVEENQDAPQA